MREIDINEIEALFDDEMWVVLNEDDYDELCLREAKHKIEAMQRIIEYLEEQ